jgi:hypothetical protein
MQDCPSIKPTVPHTAASHSLEMPLIGDDSKLMQIFTRTCHEEFKKRGVEIGIPWTKLAFEEPFQLPDL